MRPPFQAFLVAALTVSVSQADTPLSTNLPANIIRVPVAQAQCLAFHPTKPLLYVGRSDRQTDGKGLAVLKLSDSGDIIPDGRVDIADGIVGSSSPLSDDLQYSIKCIAVNPVLPQIYVAAAAKYPRAFKENTNTCYMASLALDNDGLPTSKADEYRNTGRNVPIHHMTCDALGRFVYFGELHGDMGFWPTGDEEPVRVSEALKRPRDRSALKRKAPRSQAREHLVSPPMHIFDWVYVAEWRRSYGSNEAMHKAIFTFNDDGRSCSFAQGFTVQGRNNHVPQVSVKHEKLYVPNAEGSKLGIYLLTREGRFTSIPRFVSIDMVKEVCVDDRNDRFYVAQPGGVLSVYALDADGIPAGEPQRYDLQAGEIKEMTVSTKGVLYLACSAPPGGKP